ncbi:MAG: diguanylate cyclase [Deltaproteobacteria bacterium]|nr:diguanylate cyclase [Deltaproteobacteria bacterium]
MSSSPEDDLKNIRDKKNFIERLRENDEIRLKFFEIQIDLLPLTTFTSLFETLIKKLEQAFGLPHVWLSFIDGLDKINLIQTLSSSDFLKQRLSVVEEGVFRDIFKDSATPILFNKDSKAIDRLYPKGENYPIRSAALAPLYFHGTIIGSLNHGDTAEGRYPPDADTTLLAQLTKVVSTCLANIAAYEELKLNASRDHLTGLLNRRVMESALDREYKRALRYGEPLSLIILDMDDLKVINDGHGHDAGDAVLKYLGQKLLEMSRESDIVTRFGGDEFVLILPGTDSAKARETIERLKGYFANNPMRWDDTTLSVSFCYGFAEIRDDAVHDPASLLKQADLLLYKAKRRKNKTARVIQIKR